YSDTGFILLAELVHRVSGETLDRFAQKHFYTPLGMRHTTFRPPESWRARIAPTEIVNGGLPCGGVPPRPPPRLRGGGRPRRALLDGGRSLALLPDAARRRRAGWPALPRGSDHPRNVLSRDHRGGDARPRMGHCVGVLTHARVVLPGRLGRPYGIHRSR